MSSITALAMTHASTGINAHRISLLCFPSLPWQGTLRDALDNGMLLRGRDSSSSSRCMHPGLALGLAQDIAAALLHLHAEGAWVFEQVFV